MYDTHPARTATVQYTPRQWTRYLLALLDDDAAQPSHHLISHVCLMLLCSEQYPDDKIAVSATPREAAMIAAQMRDLTQRNA